MSKFRTSPFAQYRSARVAAGIALLAAPCAVLAQTPPAIIPGPADSGRLRAEEIMPQQPQTVAPPISSVEQAPLIRAPKGAEKVQFILRDFQFKGAAAPLTRTQEDRLEKRYADLIGKKISLHKVYEIANAITLDYRARGFLLSYAYVPNQKIASGTVRIAVVEGYIGTVAFPKDDPNADLLQGYTDRLYAEKPITQRTLESVLLRISDIPGRHYRAVLSRTKDMPPGASLVTLVPSEKPASLRLGVDNFGSRYLGPMQATLSYSDSFLPAQQTAITALTSVPTDELTYGTLNHYVILAPDISLEGTISVTRSQAGYQLEELDIRGDTQEARLDLGYQLLRQRSENLLLKAGIIARHSSSDFLGDNPLTRDDIRIARGEAIYNTSDRWNGSNQVNVSLSAGISGFGSSKRGDADLSRAEARPDFTKAELSVSRLQRLTSDWSTQIALSGQWASSPLYASEEFGVGGVAFGRGYDTSEIIGDDGVAASWELRYGGLQVWDPVLIEPFIFYDFGWIHNRDEGQPKRESLTSAGGGIRFATEGGGSGMVALGFPLTHEVSAPIYGAGPNDPRFIVQYTQSLDTLGIFNE